MICEGSRRLDMLEADGVMNLVEQVGALRQITCEESVLFQFLKYRAIHLVLKIQCFEITSVIKICL